MLKKGRKVHYFNKIYTQKNRYHKPKEIFSYLIKILRKEKIKKNSLLIDVGCANGELLYNLHKNLKNVNLTGIDVDKTLLKKAKENCPKNIPFLKKDISKKVKGLKKYDIVIFSGVLSIFKNGDSVLKNLLSLVKPNGKIFIFDSFNVYSYNLHIKANTVKNKKKITWYKNMYSTNYINDFFKKNKRRCKFYRFRLKKNIKPNKSNLNYGWTENLSGKKIITSGLGLIQNQFWVKIEKNSK